MKSKLKKVSSNWRMHSNVPRLFIIDWDGCEKDLVPKNLGGCCAYLPPIPMLNNGGLPKGVQIDFRQKTYRLFTRSQKSHYI